MGISDRGTYNPDSSHCSKPSYQSLVPPTPDMFLQGWMLSVDLNIAHRRMAGTQTLSNVGLSVILTVDLCFVMELDEILAPNKHTEGNPMYTEENLMYTDLMKIPKKYIYGRIPHNKGAPGNSSS